MMGFFGEPTRPLTKPENPDFFLRTATLGSFASSENLLEPDTSITFASCVLSAALGSADTNVAEWGTIGLMIRVSVFDLTNGGGKEGLFAEGEESFEASRRLRMAAPSKGAPTKSSVLLWRRGFW